MTLKKILVCLLLSLTAVSAWAKPPGPPHHGMAPPPPPPPSPYAHIHYDMGQGMPKLDVDCGAQTSIRDCADVITSLLDKTSEQRRATPKPPKP